jgi:hypothetical protein
LALAVPKEVAPGSLAAPSGGRRGSLTKVTRLGGGFRRRGGGEQWRRASEADGDGYGDGRKTIFIARNCYRG